MICQLCDRLLCTHLFCLFSEGSIASGQIRSLSCTTELPVLETHLPWTIIQLICLKFFTEEKIVYNNSKTRTKVYVHLFMLIICWIHAAIFNEERTFLFSFNPNPAQIWKKNLSLRKCAEDVRRAFKNIKTQLDVLALHIFVLHSVVIIVFVTIYFAKFSDSM